jgi:hypothetical protein
VTGGRERKSQQQANNITAKKETQKETQKETKKERSIFL